MKKLNKRLVSRICLLVLMVGILTFFTGCTFSSSNIDLGISQLGHGARMVFDSIVDGLVMAVVGFFEGIWELIVGFFTLIGGAIAWVFEAIAGLFK